MIKYVCDYELVRAREGDSGYDLRCARSAERMIPPGERWLVPTSLYLEMPIGVEGQIRSRSGLALQHGVIVLNAPGTIDSGYRGEIGVTLVNLGQVAWTMTPGERIAQIAFCPVFAPSSAPGILSARVLMTEGIQRVASREELSATDRGLSGHGSTGR